VYKVCVPDLVPEIIVHAVHHIPSPGASTAREKGFAGPAQERRDSGTLGEMWCSVTTPGPPVVGCNQLKDTKQWYKMA
jgi:hypothetical protein